MAINSVTASANQAANVVQQQKPPVQQQQTAAANQPAQPNRAQPTAEQQAQQTQQTQQVQQPRPVVNTQGQLTGTNVSLKV